MRAWHTLHIISNHAISARGATMRGYSRRKWKIGVADWGIFDIRWPCRLLLANSEMTRRNARSSAKVSLGEALMTMPRPAPAHDVLAHCIHAPV